MIYIKEYTCIYSFSDSFPSRLLQNLAYTSLCYTAGSCWLSYIEQGVHVGLPRWRLPMQEMQEPSVRSLGCEGSLEWKTATRSSILAWEVPWMEEPGAQAVESQGIGQV